MSLNPYSPPEVSAPTLALEQESALQTVSRPIGITILCIVHLLIGLAFLAILVLVVAVMGQQEQEGLRLPLAIVIGVFGFYISIGLATPVGMWRGARWGWWMAAFYYTWGVLGSVADLILPLFQDLDGYFQYVVAAAPKAIALFAVHGLILTYLFMQSVRRFFRITTLPAMTALVPLAIGAIVLMAGTFAAMHWLAIEN